MWHSPPHRGEYQAGVLVQRGHDADPDADGGVAAPAAVGHASALSRPPHLVHEGVGQQRGEGHWKRKHRQDSRTRLTCPTSVRSRPGQTTKQPFRTGRQAAHYWLSRPSGRAKIDGSSYRLPLTRYPSIQTHSCKHLEHGRLTRPYVSAVGCYSKYAKEMMGECMGAASQCMQGKERPMVRTNDLLLQWAGGRASLRHFVLNVPFRVALMGINATVPIGVILVCVQHCRTLYFSALSTKARFRSMAILLCASDALPILFLSRQSFIHVPCRLPTQMRRRPSSRRTPVAPAVTRD